MIRAALIDLDGTLVDTVSEIAAAANAMLAAAGREPVSDDVAAQAVGEGSAVLVDRLMGPGSSTQWLPVFLEHYHTINGTTAGLYPQVREGLSALRDDGLKVACVTNKPRELIAKLFEVLGIASSFDAIVGGGDTVDKKPKPAPLLLACERMGVAPAEAVMIGDSQNDAIAAQAAGMRSLTVPYGYPGMGGDEVTPPSLLARGLTQAIVADLVDAARWIARENEPRAPTSASHPA